MLKIKKEGAVWLKVTITGKNTELRRTPILHQGNTFVAGGLTFGVTQGHVDKLVESSRGYYDISTKFFPCEGDPLSSTSYSVESLKEFLRLSSTPEWLLFTRNEVRPEVKEMREELGATVNDN